MFKFLYWKMIVLAKKIIVSKYKVRITRLMAHNEYLTMREKIGTSEVKISAKFGVDILIWGSPTHKNCLCRRRFN